VQAEGDQAVVTSHLSFKVSPMPLTMDSGIVDVWTRRDGQWQVRTRYLGESRMGGRLAFAAGVVAATLAMLAWWGLRALLRRRRRASPA
jgi:hypothetical protein